MLCDSLVGGGLIVSMETTQHIMQVHLLSTCPVTHVVQFVVEAAGVAHGVSVGVPPPQGGGGGLTVGTAGSCSSGCRLRRERTSEG